MFIQFIDFDDLSKVYDSISVYLDSGEIGFFNCFKKGFPKFHLDGTKETVKAVKRIKRVRKEIDKAGDVIQR
nr:11796_t:CDS:2 [Entrophospora candida]